MRVAKIRIQNVMGIEEFELLNPGSITTVEARNGKGKTSLIEAIRSVMEGGHDATLLRNGADSGEVVIVLDDETEITKRITLEKSDLTVRRPDIGTVGSPKKYVERLFNALSVNPVAFLMLPEKSQAQALLEALPLELDRGAIEEAVGDLLPLRDSDFRGHALDVLGGVQKRVYDERTGVNRAGKEKKATVEQLSQSLPEDADRVANEVAPLDERHQALSKEFLDAETRIEQAAQAEIQKLRAETQQKIDELKEAEARRADEIRQEVDVALDAIAEEYRPKLDQLVSEISAAREREKNAVASENTRQVVKQMQAEVDALTDRSRGLTAALAQLDALKLGLVKGLPIKGIEVRDGILYKGDVPFRRLNRAEQVKVAIRLAQLRAGDVPLVCVDGIEALDGPTFEAFKAHAAKTDLQFIVTRVTPETDSAPDGLHVTSSAREAVPA